MVPLEFWSKPGNSNKNKNIDKQDVSAKLAWKCYLVLLQEADMEYYQKLNANKQSVGSSFPFLTSIGINYILDTVVIF